MLHSVVGTIAISVFVCRWIIHWQDCSVELEDDHPWLARTTSPNHHRLSHFTLTWLMIIHTQLPSQLHSSIKGLSLHALTAKFTLSVICTSQHLWFIDFISGFLVLLLSALVQIVSSSPYPAHQTASTAVSHHSSCLPARILVRPWSWEVCWLLSQLQGFHASVLTLLRWEGSLEGSREGSGPQQNLPVYQNANDKVLAWVTAIWNQGEE